MRKKILIADDDRALRAALSKRLIAWGYAVVESADGLGVIGNYLARDVSAMILDYEMPNGDGQAVAYMLRNETDVPIIFLSGHSKEEFRSVIFSLSDTYYVPKPIVDDDLRRVLQKALREPAETTCSST